MEILAGGVLVALALVHLAIWLPRYNPELRSWNARDSWLLAKSEVDERGTHITAVVAALVTAGCFVAAGLGTIRGASWASELTAGAAGLSLLLTLLYFHPWLSLLVVVDLAVLVLAL